MHLQFMKHCFKLKLSKKKLSTKKIWTRIHELLVYGQVARPHVQKQRKYLSLKLDSKYLEFYSTQ